MLKQSHILIVSLLIIAFFIPGFSSPVFAARPDFSICSGLTNPGLGLCRAGVAAGCADGSGNPGACERIEMNFIDRTGELPPWLEPVVICPCDYRTLVPQTAEAWSDEDGNPKVIVLNCDAGTASLQAVNPTPQLPVVNAIVTSEVPSQYICQALPYYGTGEVAGELTSEELSACRAEVLDYANEMLALFPTWPWVDNCSTP